MTYLADIIVAQGARDHRLVGDLKRRAGNEFARLNGWKLSDASTGFTIQAIGSQEIFYGLPSRGTYTTAFFDHPLKFREIEKPYRPVALVGQPYQLPQGELRFRGKLGSREVVDLDWHVAPAPLASIHFPGSCYFCVVTKVGTRIEWLPEQLDVARYGELAR